MQEGSQQVLKGSGAGPGSQPCPKLLLPFPCHDSIGLSLCPFLNGKFEACPPEGMHGGRERTLLIPHLYRQTGSSRQGTAEGPVSALLHTGCWGLPGRNHAEHWSLSVCPSQMGPSYSLSLVRLGLLLPAGQCRLLVPSTVRGGVREGFSAV